MAPPNRLPLIGNIAGGQIRKDQHIGRSAETIKRKKPIHNVFADGRVGAMDDNPQAFQFPARQLTTVYQGRTGNTGGAVLVVMENRNGHQLGELFFDAETVRCFNVLKVDAAERRLQQFYGPDKRIRIMGIDFDIKDIQVCKALKKLDWERQGLQGTTSILPGRGSL